MKFLFSNIDLYDHVFLCAQQCMALLDEGAREALSDVVARVLRRNLADGRDEDLDCTLLTWDAQMDMLLKLYNTLFSPSCKYLSATVL